MTDQVIDGPWRATRLWNSIVRSLQEGMTLKKHRYSQVLFATNKNAMMIGVIFHSVHLNNGIIKELSFYQAWAKPGFLVRTYIYVPKKS